MRRIAIVIIALLTAVSGETFAQEDDNRYLIMPLGNSLTNDSRSRTALWRTIEDITGFDEDDMWFVGSQVQPSDIPPSTHEGVGGDEIKDVAEKINSLLEEYEPNFISLLIGTNDIAWDFKHETPEAMLEVYNDLLDQMIQNGSSNMWIVAASIPPMASEMIDGYDRAEYTQEFNVLLKELIEDRFNNGDQILYAEVAENLTVEEHVSEDGVHLNDEGYQVMGRQQALALIEAFTFYEDGTIISNNTLSPSNVHLDRFTIEFEKASDGNYPDSTLQYILYLSASNNLNTVSDAEENGVIAASGIDVNELTATELDANTEYWVNIVVQDPGGQSGIYESTSVTTIIPEPILQAPANNVNNVQVNPIFEWEEVEGAENYEIQISTDENFDEVVVENAEVVTFSPEENLEAGTSYYWRVRAVYDNVPGGWSETWNFETIQLPAVITLIAPDNNATDADLNQEFEWQHSDSAESYEIEIAADSEFENTVLDSSGIEANIFVMVDEFENATQYFWRVRGENTGGFGEWSETWNFTTKWEPPATVQLLEPEDEGEVSTLPIIVWSSSAFADAYYINLSKEETFEELVFDSVFTAPDTLYEFVEDLEPYTEYYWRVQAANQGGTSEWSEVFEFYVHGGLSTEEESVPTDFALLQNYPNPFNPTTKIRYGLPEASDVLLEVYNMLGQKVSVLVNERKSAGWHTQIFDASNLSSGFYIYRIKARNFTSTKKLMVIK